MFWQSAKDKRIKQLEFERDALRFDVESLKTVNSGLRKALSTVTAREAETLRVARQGLSNIGANLDTGSRNRQTDSRLISDSGVSRSTPHDNFVYGSVAGSSPTAFSAGGGNFGGGGASETWEASCPSPDTSSSTDSSSWSSSD